MPLPAHVNKVLAYITYQGSLLVFRQPDFPDAGLQIPGGTVEAGEALEAAALREAHEETGLLKLKLVAYLGCTEYQLKVDIGPPHRRHFFHLSYAEPGPSRWEHFESAPSLGGPPIRFELWWEPLGSVRLDWEMDALLPRVVLRGSGGGCAPLCW
jgi:8-oxo-dGTP pyrophosphatase MutT (NUDIX family)